MSDLRTLLDEHAIHIVSVFLVVAAWIDGKELRVPNKLTYPFIAAGLVVMTVAGGWTGLGMSLLGAFVGMMCLLPLYAVGGMGSGDVKMMMGMGAWLGAQITWDAFYVSVIVGAVMALIMIAATGRWRHHWNNAVMIVGELFRVRNPWLVSEAAAERKPNMALLPYGIPICIGSIGYFISAGLM